jgi:hypothetical protein
MVEREKSRSIAFLCPAFCAEQTIVYVHIASHLSDTFADFARGS